MAGDAPRRSSPVQRPVPGPVPGPATRRFVIGRRTGGADELHGFEPNVADPHLAGQQVVERAATWFEVDRAALVLGSAQPLAHVDLDACRAAGVDLARRRSGGGAVLVVPGEMLWLDVVIGAGDPLWDDDIGRSMWWLGDVWADALRSLGAAAGVAGALVEVHRGPVRRTNWSNHVCFDGLGAGEVTIDGAKAVGISQRRTRSWARLQSSMHVVWRGEMMAALLSPPRPTPAELHSPASLSALAGPRYDVDSAVAALVQAVEHSIDLR